MLHKLTLNNIIINIEKNPAYLFYKINHYVKNKCTLERIVSEEKNTTETFSGYIPEHKLDITYCRSSGPGGQNVNKSNTKVDVRFHVPSADWINDTVKHRLLEKKDINVTRDHFLVVRSEETRYAHLNLEKALRRLRNIIEEVSKVKPTIPSPEVQTMLVERRKKANVKRIETKRYRSMIHQSRNVIEF